MSITDTNGITTPQQLIDRLSDLIAQVETLQCEIEDETLDTLRVPDVHDDDTDAPLSFALEDVFCRLTNTRAAVRAHAEPPQVGRLYRVTRTLQNCHPIYTDYELEYGDVLAPTPSGTWTKLTGLSIGGFTLKPSYLACLELLPQEAQVQLVGNL